MEDEGAWPLLLPKTGLPRTILAKLQLTQHQFLHGTCFKWGWGCRAQMSHGDGDRGAVVVALAGGWLAFFPELIPKVKILALWPEHGVKNCQSLGNKRQ